MKFDASTHRCIIVVDQNLSAGLAINAASVVAVSVGRLTENLVGGDLRSRDGVSYPGVVTAPLPVLLASGDYLRELHTVSKADDALVAVPFSALAQSCKTWEEYGERIAATSSEHIGLVALGMIGPKKTITRLSGNLKLYR